MKNVLILLNLFFLSTNIFSQDADKIVGYWLTQDNDSQVKIFKATNGKYYGKIIWLKDPLEEDGSAKTDNENPDKSMQNRPIQGLQLLNAFEFIAEDNMWKNGTIYDPKNGSTYKCMMWFGEDENILKVKGYLGVSIIGRQVEWAREEKLRE